MQHMFIVSTPMIRSLKSSKMHLVLPHLYKDPEYVKAYREFSDQGDILLQDNSIFELKNVVAGDLIKYAREIKAMFIMIPEVLRDSRACIRAKGVFFNELSQEDYDDFHFAAAVQGKSYEEIREHYRALNHDNRLSLIAIPFNFEFDAWGNVNEEQRQFGWNRFSIIWRLFREGEWNHNRRHHLLGLFNPAELAAYSQPSLLSKADPDIAHQVRFYKSLFSNDSSSCFWHSLYGVRFDYDKGLPYRKIESSVDFNVAYKGNAVFALFEDNKRMLNCFMQGEGTGQYVCNMYHSNLLYLESKGEI